ncbi:Hypothetical predicted protein [Marmota monax]|uniref:Uncharacterized protein n=1 Tax=Marmota monax TaxID=9995 RepID=A0A5E4CWX9_MARMO|nr:hypothetical protein GHT09_011497 [Marmota monax]VTJ86313.1 Hypothetical predicted protein [Marmota monax]
MHAADATVWEYLQEEDNAHFVVQPLQTLDAPQVIAGTALDSSLPVTGKRAPGSPSDGPAGPPVCPWLRWLRQRPLRSPRAAAGPAGLPGTEPPRPSRAPPSWPKDCVSLQWSMHPGSQGPSCARGGPPERRV